VAHPLPPLYWQVLMKTYQKTYQARKELCKDKVCACGRQAARYFGGDYICQRCTEMDNELYATERIRSTCGVPGPPDPYYIPYQMQF